MIGEREKIGIAAVILLFSLLLTELPASAILDTSKNQGSIEEKLLREGSYVYSSGYGGLSLASDFEEGYGGGELNGNILVQNSAFLSPNVPSLNSLGGIGLISRQRSGIVTYEVQAGDTPSYIAASFGISTETLLGANKLNYWSTIRPGNKLVILPVSGVIHEVKKGETLAKIIKDYKGDFEETIAYNGLPADGRLDLGQKIIIPGGRPIIYQPVPAASRYVYVNVDYGPHGGHSRKFPWGQCTWYLAQKRYIPWSGDAKNWLSNAARMGYSICAGKQCQPEVGSIVSLTGNTSLLRRYGHVGYVEAVDGNQIIFSEMNYRGLGVKSVRALSRNDWQIRGYIY